MRMHSTNGPLVNLNFPESVASGQLIVAIQTLAVTERTRVLLFSGKGSSTSPRT